MTASKLGQCVVTGLVKIRVDRNSKTMLVASRNLLYSFYRAACNAEAV